MTDSSAGVPPENPAASPIRVAIIDDQALVRMGLTMVLNAQADITVSAEADDGSGAVTLVQRDRPDVVLMDVRMPRMDGIEATARVVALPDAPKVLVLTTFDIDEYAFSAIRAGASGFLLKDAEPTELVAAVRAVHAGDAVLAPSVTKRMMRQFVEAGEPARAHADADERLADLTPRERELFIAIAEGLTNDELAARFFLSASTVKTHVGRILSKLGARDRVQLVILAYETGVVS